MGHIRRQILGRPGSGQHIHVLSGGLPYPRVRRCADHRFNVIPQQIQPLRMIGCRRQTAVPDHFSRDSLAHLHFAVGLVQNHQIGMGMPVDEAGSNDLPPGIDDLTGFRINSADGGNPAILHPDIPDVPGISAAVYNPAILDYCIKHAVLLPGSALHAIHKYRSAALAARPVCHPLRVAFP
ncbi:hypothetical protein D3C73_1037450 [compost metagenome]